jgi:toxin CptA
VIALLFVTLTIVVGPWAYTDVLVQVSRGSVRRPELTAMLVASLIVGTLVAGRRQPTFAWTRPTPLAALRCLSGGLLIGVGLLLVPGAHDTLTLLETPLGIPVAACALAVNAAVIVAALLIADRLRMQVCACATEVMAQVDAPERISGSPSPVA